MSVVINGETFDLDDIEFNEVVKEATKGTVSPCYVPGSFPWKNYT